MDNFFYDEFYCEAQEMVNRLKIFKYYYSHLRNFIKISFLF